MAGFENCGLKVLQWNCNGLFTHLDEFKHHLTQNSCDVICLQETFPKSGKNFTLAGYSIVRRDRIDKRKGGLVTLIKDSLNYTEIASPGNIDALQSILELTIATLLSVIYISLRIKVLISITFHDYFIPKL